MSRSFRPGLIVDDSAYLDDRAPVVGEEDLPECCRRETRDVTAEDGSEEGASIGFECMSCGAFWIEQL